MYKKIAVFASIIALFGIVTAQAADKQLLELRTYHFASAEKQAAFLFHF